MTVTAAVVGTGAPWIDNDDRYAMGYRHGEAYRALDAVELIACADVERSRATEFGREFGIPTEQCYADYEQLLGEHTPDIVSVCVPPRLHADLVEACAAAGVAAVHCEKPMADTWEKCKEMAELAQEHDLQLTFNHQRRFAKPFRTAKRELEQGRIGELRRIEFGAENLYDYGTHSFDLCSYFVDEVDPSWILCQIHYTRENVLFGEHNENQAVAVWEYENGVTGFASTGAETGGDVVDCHHRLVGSAGSIEIIVGFPNRFDGPQLKIRSEDGEQERYFENIGLELAVTHRSVEAAVDALETGTQPTHSVENCLGPTALIFGAWESARRRERVAFPLDIQGNPLSEMVENGTIDPQE